MSSCNARVRALRCARILALAFALAGCSQDAMLQRMVPPGADARARAYLALFQRAQVDSALVRLTPELRAQGEGGFRQLAAFLEGRSLDSARLIGVQVRDFRSDRRDERHVNLSYEFHDAKGWFIANVATVERGGDWQVEGATARTLPASLETINAFTLSGRSARHWLWLLLTVAAFATSVVVAVRVARARGMPRRWLWFVVALFGLGQFSLDWATGAWGIKPLYVMLLSAGFMKAGPVAPWILSFAIPVGAIVAEARRRRWLASAVAAPAVAAPEGEPATGSEPSAG